MKGKTLFLLIALIALIGGSTILYNSLKDKASPERIIVEAPVSARQDGDKGNTESKGHSESKDSDNGKKADTDTDADKDNDRVKAPDFAALDANGEDIRLSDMLGKPVVLNFWASWCPPCKSEMPEFNKVYEELGDTVQFMMVNAVGSRGETVRSAEDYIAKEAFTFPVFFDTKQDAVMAYGIRAFPTSIFIDSEGYIVAGVEGMIDETTLRKGISLITDSLEQ